MINTGNQMDDNSAHLFSCNLKRTKNRKRGHGLSSIAQKNISFLFHDPTTVRFQRKNGVRTDPRICISVDGEYYFKPVRAFEFRENKQEGNYAPFCVSHVLGSTHFRILSNRTETLTIFTFLQRCRCCKTYQLEWHKLFKSQDMKKLPQEIQTFG